MKTLRQLALPFKPSRGGHRPNAGRRPGPGPRRVAHRRRNLRCGRYPLHVTLRANLSCLRSQFVFPTVRCAIESLRRERGKDFRVVHFAVQENHLHLLVEATDPSSLSSGMRALGIRIARRVNRLLMRSGAVLADRWHGRELMSPRAVRHAIVYVLANFRKHGPKRHARVDPYSSAPYFKGFREFSGRAPVLIDASVIPRALAPPQLPPVSHPQTWLLASGWQRRGLISITEAPAT
jgi:putative transposase